jgi:outer membrane protein TolC
MWVLIAAWVVSATGDAPPEEPLEQVTFTQAVERALARNPTLQTAIEEIDRSRALVEQARSAWLPQLTGVGTYTHLDHDRILNGKIALAKNQINGTLFLTIPIVAAQAWANTWRADDQADVVRTLANDVRRMIALQTGRAYLTIIEQRRVVEVNERARDVARVQLDYTQQRYKGGVGNRLDVTRSGQELASDEATLQNSLESLTRAQEALGVLMGTDRPIDANGDPTLTAPTSLASAMDNAESNRTDIISGKRRLTAARRSSNLNWADYIPTLSAVGNIAYQDPPQLTLPLRSWQVQGILTIPFYDGGLRYGRAKERRALEAEAQTNLDAAERQTHSDVRTAFEEVRRAELALAASTDSAKFATESLELAELAYRTGVSTNLELVDAQRVSRDANTAAAVAADNAQQSRLDLLSASGAFPEP